MRPQLEDPLFRAWNKCNNVIVSWIILSLSPEIMGSVMSLEIAHGLWNELENWYKKGYLYRIVEQHEEMFVHHKSLH